MEPSSRWLRSPLPPGWSSGCVPRAACSPSRRRRCWPRRRRTRRTSSGWSPTASAEPRWSRSSGGPSSAACGSRWRRPCSCPGAGPSCWSGSRSSTLRPGRCRAATSAAGPGRSRRHCSRPSRHWTCGRSTSTRSAVACARRNLPPERVLEGDLYAALPGELRDASRWSPPTRRTSPPGRSRPCLPRPATTRPGSRSTAVPTGSMSSAGLSPRRRGWLAPGGLLLVETGRSQADLTGAAMRAAGLDVEVRHDPDVDGTVALGLQPRHTPGAV